MADDRRETRAWGAEPDPWSEQPDTWAQSPDTWAQQSDTWAQPSDPWAQPPPQHQAPQQADGWWADPGPRRAPERGGGTVGIAVGAAVIALLAVAGLVAVLVFNGSPDDEGTVAVGEATGTPGWTTEPGAGGTTTGDTGTTTTTTTTPATGGGGERLDDLVAESASLVEAVEGRWVPQLGAMRIGTGSAADEWTEDDIVEAFEDYRDRFPEAAMLRSGDWSVYSEPYWYVVIVARPSSDPDTALRWCRDQGFDREGCLAKNLRRGGSPEGATRLNG